MNRKTVKSLTKWTYGNALAVYSAVLIENELSHKKLKVTKSYPHSFTDAHPPDVQYSNVPFLKRCSPHPHWNITVFRFIHIRGHFPKEQLLVVGNADLRARHRQQTRSWLCFTCEDIYSPCGRKFWGCTWTSAQRSTRSLADIMDMECVIWALAWMEGQKGGRRKKHTFRFIGFGLDIV